MAGKMRRGALDLEPGQAELARELSDETGVPIVELARRGLVLLFRQMAPLPSVSRGLARRLREYELPRRSGGQG